MAGLNFRVTNIPTRGLRGLAAWLVMAVATPILLLLMLISALVYGFNEATDQWKEHWHDLRPLWRKAAPHLLFRKAEQ